MTLRWIFTRRFTLQLVAWALISLAVLSGVAAGCTDEGGRGMYQGPGDSSPKWR